MKRGDLVITNEGSTLDSENKYAPEESKSMTGFDTVLEETEQAYEDDDEGNIQTLS
jgi:hypothetical protein